MSSSNPSKALTKRPSSAETSLMPPPPPPKRIKRPATVLDEDTYTDALSHIIARDFYPGLLETQTQQEYLDAVSSRDRQWIVEAGRKLTQVMTPGPDGRRAHGGRRGVSMTPMWTGGVQETPRAGGSGGETPGSVVASSEAGEGDGQRTQVNLNLSLGGFQANYTSEDNESFYELVDKQNAKRREKYAWVWNENKIPSARQIAHQAREARLLEASKQKEEEQEKDKAGSSQSQSGSASSSRALIVQHPDARKAMVEHKRAAPRNSFMFIPDGVEDTHETRAQVAEAASLMPPRAVRYDNTRLPPATHESSLVPPSPSMSAIDAAIAGRPRGTESDPGYTGNEVPKVNGYTFVDAEPEPGEGMVDDEDVDLAASQLLARLGAVDATPNPFTIKEASRREELHHRLVDKTAKSKRSGPSAGAGRLGQLQADATPRFKSSPIVKGNLTPAAQRLFEKVGTPKRDGLGGAFGAVGKQKAKRHWTPLTTPKIKR